MQVYYIVCQLIVSATQKLKTEGKELTILCPVGRDLCRRLEESEVGVGGETR